MDIRKLVKEDFIVLDEDAPVSEMIGQLRQFEKRSALVFRNKKYQGLVEKKKLLRLRIDTSETKLKHYLQVTPIVKDTADVMDTVRLIADSDFDFLPVEKNKEVIGVISSLDLAGLAMNIDATKKWKVNDIKYTKVKKLNKDDPIATVITLMHDTGIDVIPLYESGKLYGVISYKDILRKYLNWNPKRDISAKFNKMASSRSGEGDNPHLSSLPAESFATTDNLLSVVSTAGIAQAVSLMLEKNLTSLPVMEKNEVVGMLTVKNILRNIANLQKYDDFDISFIGLKGLDIDELEEVRIRDIAHQEAVKLQKHIGQEFKVILHLKAHEKDGERHKYSVTLRLETAGQLISCSEHDWDIEVPLRKVFSNAKITAEKNSSAEKKVKNSTKA